MYVCWFKIRKVKIKYKKILLKVQLKHVVTKSNKKETSSIKLEFDHCMKNRQRHKIEQI